MERTYQAYVLADSSKFSINSSVSFGNLNDATIITDKLTETIYEDSTSIIIV